MPLYQPPTRDQRFGRHELLGGVDDYRQLPAHGGLDAATIDQVVDEAGKFCAQVLLPINRSGDEEGWHYDPATRSVRTPQGFRQAWDAFRQAGWPALQADPAYGAGVAAAIERIG